MIDKLYLGKNYEVMKDFPDNFIDLVVTSPPYDSLRNYNGYSFKFEEVAEELYRTTKKGGVVVWVVGDQVVNKSESGNSFRQALHFMSLGFKLHDTMIYEKNGSSFPARKDGNRYSQIFEYMFVLSKDGPPKTAHLICDKPNRWAGFTTFGQSTYRDKSGELKEREQKPVPDYSPRNNIWRYNTGKNYSTKDDEAFAHPAIFPEALAQDHILSWSNEGDLVLDPFNGSGTTTKMAYLLNRHYIGIDMTEEYNDIAQKRLDKIKII
jgi:DNA modification methylase